MTASSYINVEKLKGYITKKVYLEFRGRYKECIRMLNGVEKTLERKVPERERRYQLAEESAVYCVNDETLSQGCTGAIFRSYPGETKENTGFTGQARQAHYC